MRKLTGFILLTTIPFLDSCTKKEDPAPPETFCYLKETKSQGVTTTYVGTKGTLTSATTKALGTSVATVTADGSGNISTITMDGITITITYTTFSRPTRATFKYPTAVPGGLTHVDYEYNVSFQLVATQQYLDNGKGGEEKGNRTEYQYINALRKTPTTITRFLASGATDYSLTMEYDGKNNFLRNYGPGITFFLQSPYIGYILTDGNFTKATMKDSKGNTTLTVTRTFTYNEHDYPATEEYKEVNAAGQTTTTTTYSHSYECSL